MSDRDELASDFIDRMVREAVDRTTFELDAKAEAALWAAGWRKKPSRGEVAEWVSGNFVVSNGTQAWVEFQGSIDGFTDMVLALLDGLTETGEK